tara:strand:+ start:45 stop:203 length:159 start_codon:yes stop_codon:yes gene_type:complete
MRNKLLGSVKKKVNLSSKIIERLTILGCSYIVAVGIYYKMLKMQYEENKKYK